MDGKLYSQYVVEELFNQLRMLEEIRFSYIEEKIIEEAIKKVQKEIDKMISIK